MYVQISPWDIFEKFLHKIFQNYFGNFEVLLNTSSVQDEKDDENKSRPDIVIKASNEIKLIIDAKYKWTVSAPDKRQVGDYIRRFMIPNTSPKYRNAILVYPEGNYKFNHDDDIENNQAGIVYWHSIDLTKVNVMQYIKIWLSDFDKFL